MRNTFTLYSPKIDLRGKKVELRCGAVEQIPEDASRYVSSYGYVAYPLEDGQRAYQMVCRPVYEGYQHPFDIMKVIK